VSARTLLQLSTSSLTTVKGITMKIELRINGRYEIELSPESEIERVILSEMSERADKGQSVSFTVHEENCCRSCRIGVDQ